MCRGLPLGFQELAVITYYSTCAPLEGVLGIELPFLEPLFLTTPFFIFSFLSIYFVPSFLFIFFRMGLGEIGLYYKVAWLMRVIT